VICTDTIHAIELLAAQLVLTISAPSAKEEHGLGRNQDFYWLEPRVRLSANSFQYDLSRGD
jgi:hypothetical protein